MDDLIDATAHSTRRSTMTSPIDHCLMVSRIHSCRSRRVFGKIRWGWGSNARQKWSTLAFRCDFWRSVDFAYLTTDSSKLSISQPEGSVWLLDEMEAKWVRFLTFSRVDVGVEVDVFGLVHQKWASFRSLSLAILSKDDPLSCIDRCIWMCSIELP